MADLQKPPEGFGSYLDGILPPDIALSAGAFSTAMQQIRNIQYVNFEKFAQVAPTIEVTTKGLTQVNGTDVPTNIPLAKTGETYSALGTGPNGGYTFSDFFGAMSGLPYPWKEIYDLTLSAQTAKLSTIYSELFLAVTWEQAFPGGYVWGSLTKSEQVQPYIPPVYDPTTGALISAGQNGIWDWYYMVPSSLPANVGGGYGRGDAPAPIVTVVNANSGASVTAIVGKNKKDSGSRAINTNLYTGHTYTPGPGTYGRLTFKVNQGSWTKYGTNTGTGPADPGAPTVTVFVQCPPTQTLTVPDSAIPTGGANGGTGSPWYHQWPGMNGPVASYISQANAEISKISNTKADIVKKLNAAYHASGTQLTIEQRSRFTGLNPVPIINAPIQPKADGTPGTGLGPTGYGYSTGYGKDNFMNLFPNSVNTFVDAMPELSQNTLPHMSTQTLEAISDLATPGGQSQVAKMREERNEKRLQELGIQLDNNVPGAPELPLEKMLQRNGTAPIATEGAGVPVTGINGFPNQPAPITAAPESPVTEFTIPATLAQLDENEVLITPIPIGFEDPNSEQFIVTNKPAPATPISNILAVEQNQNVAPVTALGVKQVVVGQGTGKANGPVTVTFSPPNLPNGATPTATGQVADEVLTITVTNPGNGYTAPPTVTATGGGVGYDIVPVMAPQNIVINASPTNPNNLLGPTNPNNLLGPAGNGTGPNAIPVVAVGGIGTGEPIDLGQANVPGSLASSPYQNLVPINLNPIFTSGILLPNTLTVAEAIDEVIKCNCDCWVQ